MPTKKIIGNKKKKEKKKLNHLKIKSTRKVYIPFYFMIIIILGFIFFIKITGRELNKTALILMIVFIVLILKLTEIHRFSNSYEIGDSSLICSKGILTKNIKRIDYFAISDINVHQGLLQRLLGFGDVIVSLFSFDEATKIKNINNPEELALKIEKAAIALRGIKNDKIIS